MKYLWFSVCSYESASCINRENNPNLTEECAIDVIELIEKAGIKDYIDDAVNPVLVQAFSDYHISRFEGIMTPDDAAAYLKFWENESLEGMTAAEAEAVKRVEELLAAKAADYDDVVKLRKAGKLLNDGEGLVPDKGFSSFTKSKTYLESPGENKAWHHIVERSQIGKRANFAAEQVHNVNNIVSIPTGKGSVHSAISAYYSSIPASGFTNKLTVRDWLSDKSFQEQFEFGLDILRQIKDGYLYRLNRSIVYERHM